LITADFALELGREVFAVPGEITSALSAGTNDLIRQGATPLLRADDVLEAVGLERSPPPVPDTLSAGAQALLTPLSETARTLDELGRLTGLESAQLAAALTELELAGLVAAADGVYRSTTGGMSMA
jgi:DNA processing protein